MSKAQRDKGRRGQTVAETMLTSRDWTVDPITAGVKREDMIATSPEGIVYSVEVKNCIVISLAHRKQAMEQARARKLPWMLMSKIHGTHCWLVQRRNCMPVVWQEDNREFLL